MQKQSTDCNNSLWSKHPYTKLYGALKEMEAYDVRLSIPEFVFVGFQSSGKTSAVSQAAKLALGVMKHGTASRCPTRFKLIANPNQKTALITVNGVKCANEKALTSKTLSITKQLEEEGIFSKDIIEVRIESDSVPELTFVDLPGLIKADSEQYQATKTQLDELTQHFLHQQNADGSYRYIPILVTEPVDMEHDTNSEVKYIDHLVEQWNGSNPRVRWMKDTLFVCNKFDKQINRSPASSLIEYMEYCCRNSSNQTVLVMMNPNSANTANMTFEQLNHFVVNAEAKEEEKWHNVLHEFEQLNDPNLFELKRLKNEICGISKMNHILAANMSSKEYRDVEIATYDNISEYRWCQFIIFRDPRDRILSKIYYNPELGRDKEIQFHLSLDYVNER
eukprot:191097_1